MLCKFSVYQRATARACPRGRERARGGARPPEDRDSSDSNDLQQCLFDLVMINVHSSSAPCAVLRASRRRQYAVAGCRSHTAAEPTISTDCESVWGYLCIESLCVVFIHNKVQCFSDFATRPNHASVWWNLMLKRT